MFWSEGSLQMNIAEPSKRNVGAELNSVLCVLEEEN
jgi:hypothetical protein